MPHPIPTRRLALALLPMLLAACASPLPPETVGPVAKEQIVAVSSSHRLLRFNAGQPQRILDSKPLQGLRDGERLIGLDYRVARGELFALGASGQLYRIDVAAARALPVGQPSALPTAAGATWGFNFNPAVDRIRVVTSNGDNLRLHPDTGAIIDADPALPGVQLDGRLAYDAKDAAAGRAPAVVAVAYTYNKQDEKLTTNFALDGRAGTLVTMGSREGLQPVVSPNSGRLFTVGSLGVGAFAEASMDISDLDNTAYAALRPRSKGPSRWYRIDLQTGAARFVGTVGGGEALIGAAIEP